MTRYPTRADAEADLRSILEALDPAGTVAFDTIERQVILYDPVSDEMKPWWVDEIFDIDRMLWRMRSH